VRANRRLLAGAAVAAFVGVAGAAIAERPPGAMVVTAGFLAAVTVASMTDLAERRIPNALTYPGVVVGLLIAVPGGGTALASAALGVLISAGALGAFWAVSRGQLGLGDVKFAAFAGAVLGVQAAPLFLVAGTSLGALAAVVLLLRGHDRRSTFAYGPYLAAGAAIAVLVDGPLMS